MTGNFNLKIRKKQGKSQRYPLDIKNCSKQLKATPSSNSQCVAACQRPEANIKRSFCDRNLDSWLRSGCCPTRTVDIINLKIENYSSNLFSIIIMLHMGGKPWDQGGKLQKQCFLVCFQKWNGRISIEMQRDLLTSHVTHMLIRYWYKNRIKVVLKRWPRWHPDATPNISHTTKKWNDHWDYYFYFKIFKIHMYKCSTINNRKMLL